jgi:IclR family KDG regulon transcriptional repressor
LSGPVRAVERALNILLCFGHNGTALSLTQIFERVGIHKSTVHRLLASLESKHFVYRASSTGLYHLGFRFIEMASLVLQDVDIQHWVRPYLQRLCAECDETVDLSVLDNAHVIYLEVVESSQRIKLAAAVGQRLPAFCTASGKAFLAYLPNEQVRQVLSVALTHFTACTKILLADLYQDLRITRERGFATSEQEYEQDIHAIAAPILDAHARPIAAIAITGPSFRLPRERMLMLGESIRSTTEAIVREMSLATLSVFVSKTVAAGNIVQIQQRGQHRDKKLAFVKAADVEGEYQTPPCVSKLLLAPT